MKKYICVNFLQCDYADEKPPIEFELADVLNNVCPECGSSNIREVKTVNKFPIRYVLLGLGVIGTLFLLYSWFRDDGVKKVKGVSPVAIQRDSTEKKPYKDTTAGTGEREKKQQKVDKPSIPVVWTRVPGSEFCVSNCVQTYDEVDNLGHTQQRKIENCADCEMDEK